MQNGTQREAFVTPTHCRHMEYPKQDSVHTIYVSNPAHFCLFGRNCNFAPTNDVQFLCDKLFGQLPQSPISINTCHFSRS